MFSGRPLDTGRSDRVAEMGETTTDTLTFIIGIYFSVCFYAQDRASTQRSAN